MPITSETLERLATIPNLIVSQNIPLSQYTRFGIGGPAAAFAEAADESAFGGAIRIARESATPVAVIGSGTNLIVSDEGFDGLVLRLTARGMTVRSMTASGAEVTAAAGEALQDLVDFVIEHGLGGLETMTGIPGSVGAAVYGNAGAYGRSISEATIAVRFWDGERVCEFTREQCEFEYRGSIFKRRKGSVIFAVRLRLDAAERVVLRRTAEGILEVRNQKYPPEMRCAGSIFKNLILEELPKKVARVVPDEVVREGKVPSAWFLEQVGAKGMRRGAIQVADYHANLIYNDGGGTAADLHCLIVELKRRVRERFGLELEEEVQYVGF